MKPAIAITVGDCNGIGPEVALKAARRASVRTLCRPLLVGPAEVFLFYADRLKMPLHLVPFSPDAALGTARRGTIPVIESSAFQTSAIRPGAVSSEAGRTAVQAIEAAVRYAKAGHVAAIVTAPVSKHALHLAGVRFPGQTEMLQSLTGSPSVAMMLVSKTLRVGLATIHLPLRDVPAALTRELLIERCTVIHDALRRDWRIKNPSLAVLGLNPHAGEHGHLGVEEEEMIRPVIETLRASGIDCEGPFPSDAFFARYRPGSFDAVIAMYHDQGLIPLKMTGAGKSVNFSAGLSVVRTSPDHGTAFDIAGKGTADASSMIEAIRLAVAVARNRSKSKR